MKRLPVILLSIIILALALVISCKEPEPENNLNTQENWILDADGIAPADKSLVKGTVVIPSEVDGVKVTKIKFGAFRDCTELTGITIPDTVTYIGMGSFSGCTNLASLTIPSSVTTIKYAAFQGCGITSLVIPDTVKILE
ncbi:MAG: leucine-rich repeat domain-containing protein, partial [Spirochaetales bacterium]|nr:leucine-rich repeat domain-containing protein [Spirochaetales bacterium]